MVARSSLYIQTTLRPVSLDSRGKRLIAKSLKQRHQFTFVTTNLYIKVITDPFG